MKKVSYVMKDVSQYAIKPKTKVEVDLINSIPLTPATQKAFEELSKDDEKPFEFVQELKFGEKYPATDGSIFSKEFMKSFISKLDDAPIVGSAYGHVSLSVWNERVENHTYMIGAKIIDDETVLFRQYVSKDMNEHEYKKLMKEIKAGLLSTSICSHAKWKVEVEGQDDSLVITETAVESIGNERNDIVEWNQTGMAVKVVGTSQKAIPEKNIKGDMTMDLDEAILLVKETSQKMGSDNTAMAEKLGFGDMIITTSQKEKIASYDELEKLSGGNLKDFVEKSITSQKENFSEIKKLALNKAFGENEKAIVIASDLIGDNPMTAKELDEKIKLVSEKESIKDALSQGADTRTKVSGQKDTNNGTKVYQV